MKLASVLSPLSDHNLRLAAQCGVEGVVHRYPGPGLEDLLAVKEKIEAQGMQLMGVEGFLPIEKIKTGTDSDGAELALMKQLVINMGKAGVSMLCYNFMAGTDWVRTRMDAPERGGAQVTAFRLADVKNAVSLNDDRQTISEQKITAEQLWENLATFLAEIIPVAEAAGVVLAMHPDDPPIAEFRGKERIMNSAQSFERLLALNDHPSNAICFCLGSFAALGLDTEKIQQVIGKLGNRIAYVHFRDVRGTPEDFAETFHDNGPTDMAAIIRSLREVGFDGPLRPDHVPQYDGEFDLDPGYTMLGRLFAFGYIRGLLHATVTAD
ncbi:MAG: mannonate dehydratase [Verrucomicrobiota bacterium]